MKDILQKFTSGSLFDASASLLDHFKIKFTPQTKTPISFEELYRGATSSSIPKSLVKVVNKIANTYIIGSIDEDSLQGRQSAFELGKPIEGKYQTMLVFAVEVKQGETLTRTELAILTRGFNRMADSLPVIIFVKNGNYLSLATCERSQYTQQWREGEKLGKVSILRDINCAEPHRGHLDILELMSADGISTFDALYKKWLEVFSNETLTKRFYRELQNWYFAALKVVRFPNDISTTSDDTAYNSEATIRLITRLIFVWFLKQRNLIPGELFDPNFVGDKLLKQFNPIEPQGLFSETQRVSYYYRGILQNLFFATLNTPLTKEGKTELTERRFKTSRDQFDVNVLMRYRDLFKDPDLFLKLCNRVPFLNGGLFDCLDRKSKGLYYDGFSERKASIDQLCVPDYLFFSDNIHADLSAEYDDKKQKNVIVRGLIKIFNSYQFTVEENTPLDQEVALDPELLGKVFENLLASFNPETKQTARKQTGSFYTPRLIVQYMVDESLIAHLNRTVGCELENEYRKLLSYSDVPLNLTPKQKHSIMLALYNCKILDPACGSGAFPMGILQKMVHILTKIDPDNTQWKEMLLNIAINDTSEAYRNSTDNERQEAILDIERSFNDKVNRPDYARKLYLIENCIYGVDIQPIAIQISKLRFFISLVIDQKCNDNPAENYGIRPLPNLEAKFVAADSLHSLSGDVSLGDSVPSVKQLKDKLKRINHRIFSVKSHKWKKELEKRLEETRLQLAEEVASVGMFSESESTMLAGWDMFEQNTHAEYFDPEWMFGIKDGFDIVIANPPYVSIKDIPSNLVKIYKSKYYSAKKQTDLYAIFLEKAISLSKREGIICFIVPDSLNDRSNFEPIRFKILKDSGIISLLTLNKVFDSATVGSSIIISSKGASFPQVKLLQTEDKVSFANNDIKTHLVPQRLLESNESKAFLFLSEKETALIQRLMKSGTALACFSEFMGRGEEIGGNADVISYQSGLNKLSFVNGSHVSRYSILDSKLYIDKADVEKDLYKYYSSPKICVRQVGTSINATIDVDNCVCPQSIYIIRLSNEKESKYVLGLLNSRLFNFIYQKKFNTKKLFPRILLENLKVLPIKVDKSAYKTLIEYVDEIYAHPTNIVETKIDLAVYRIYGLSYNDILIIDPETTITREEYENFR